MRVSMRSASEMAASLGPLTYFGKPRVGRLDVQRLVYATSCREPSLSLGQGTVFVETLLRQVRVLLTRLPQASAFPLPEAFFRDRSLANKRERAYFHGAGAHFAEIVRAPRATAKGPPSVSLSHCLFSVVGAKKNKTNEKRQSLKWRISTSP